MAQNDAARPTPPPADKERSRRTRPATVRAPNHRLGRTPAIRPTDAVETSEYPEPPEPLDLATAQRFAQTLEFAPIGIAHVSADGRWLWVNQQLCHLFGYPREALLARHVEDLLHPEDFASLQPLAQQLLAGERERYHLAVRGRRADGNLIWMNLSVTLLRDAAGAPDYYIATLEDVTEQTKLEEALADYARELETVFDAMTDGVVVLDRAGRIVRSNQAFATLMGLEARPDFVALPIVMRATLASTRDEQGQPLPLDQSPTSRILRGEVLGTGTSGEVLVTTLMGEEKYWSITGAPLRAEDGQIVGGVEVLRDVTDRRQLEREHVSMLNVIAHELRTPLTSLKMTIQLLRRRMHHGTPPRPEQYDLMIAGVDRMNRLIDDLLDAARLETNQLTLDRARCDLTTLCQHAIQEQKLASGRAITAWLPAAPVYVDADHQRISQVLTNLLTNALKYSPADRPVTVRMTVDDCTARVEVGDNGPGIPPEHLCRIFARFYRVPGIQIQHGNGVGLGIGLYISKALVERHGGQIGVESAAGQGATFWFTLPVLL
jgi:PAS domain S-box-containing protein